MSIPCCIWHNRLPETYEINELGYDECGLAGMGKPSVCCRNCPEVEWFYQRHNMEPKDIDFVSELMDGPPKQSEEDPEE